MHRFLLAAALAFCMLPAFATAASVIVQGNSNIFGAGHDTPPAIPNTAFNNAHLDQSGAGVIPPGVTFAPDPYLVLHFASITGRVGFNATSGLADAEGFSNVPHTAGTFLSTNVDSTAGISGISKLNRVMFLVGVFLPSGAPVSAPPALNYDTADNRASFAPVLGQTFYIGDGHTDVGVQQNFYVPTGASSLYLGFADGYHFQGAPSWYADNHGALTVNFSIDTYDHATPDPATAWLMAPPLAYLFYRARKRRA